jgi:acetyl-CoA carboxylase beta subunit
MSYTTPTPKEFPFFGGSMISMWGREINSAIEKQEQSQGLV